MKAEIKTERPLPASGVMEPQPRRGQLMFFVHWEALKLSVLVSIFSS